MEHFARGLGSGLHRYIDRLAEEIVGGHVVDGIDAGPLVGDIQLMQNQGPHGEVQFEAAAVRPHVQQAPAGDAVKVPCGLSIDRFGRAFRNPSLELGGVRHLMIPDNDGVVAGQVERVEIDVQRHGFRGLVMADQREQVAGIAGSASQVGFDLCIFVSFPVGGIGARHRRTVSHLIGGLRVGSPFEEIAVGDGGNPSQGQDSIDILACQRGNPVERRNPRRRATGEEGFDTRADSREIAPVSGPQLRAGFDKVHVPVGIAATVEEEHFFGAVLRHEPP